MSTTAAIPLETRVLSEGYGAGAWHGPDMKAALADVKPALAFWRPSSGRHNIAELVLHHAYFVRAVRSQISGRPAEPFVLPGEDWFVADDQKLISWSKIHATLESEHQKLAEVTAAIEAGSVKPVMAAADRLNLILGITCHAIYHAGQVQLIKRLKEA
jgi:DinB family protein